MTSPRSLSCGTSCPSSRHESSPASAHARHLRTHSWQRRRVIASGLSSCPHMSQCGSHSLQRRRAQLVAAGRGPGDRWAARPDDDERTTEMTTATKTLTINDLTPAERKLLGLCIHESAHATMAVALGGTLRTAKVYGNRVTPGSLTGIGSSGLTLVDVVPEGRSPRRHSLGRGRRLVGWQAGGRRCGRCTQLSTRPGVATGRCWPVTGWPPVPVSCRCWSGAGTRSSR